MFGEIISLFFTAVILGVVGSLPLGFLGSYMINRALDRGIKKGLFIAAFGSFFDALFCFASLFGIYLIIKINLLRFGLQALGVIFLAYVGFLMFFKKKEEFSFLKKADSLLGKNELGNYANDFLIVAVYYLLNPAFFVFWINISSMLHSFSLLRQSVLAQLVFSFFVGLFGFFVSYLFLKMVLKTGKNFLATDKAKKVMGIIYFIALIIFAFYVFEGLLQSFH